MTEYYILNENYKLGNITQIMLNKLDTIYFKNKLIEKMTKQEKLILINYLEDINLVIDFSIIIPSGKYILERKINNKSIIYINNLLKIKIS